MKKEEIIKKYGKSASKKIFDKMRGQTVSIAEDGNDDFYEGDIARAKKELKSHEELRDFD